MLLIVESKKKLLPFLILLILIIPIFTTVFSRESLIRYQGTGILNPGATWQESQIRERQYKNAIEKKDLLKKAYYSEKIYGLKLLIKGYFSHFSPEGKSITNRALDFEVDFLRIVENVAYAPSVKSAHQGLMNSKGHKDNIFSKNIGKIGVGVVDAGVYGKMFTQVFSN